MMMGIWFVMCLRMVCVSVLCLVFDSMNCLEKFVRMYRLVELVLIMKLI